uniref:hypothetical protein n=1 Tax=Poriella subacida TaxID=2872513 RepID=UPI003002B5EF|nr:hypothetical protein [Poriella subacida]
METLIFDVVTSDMLFISLFAGISSTMLISFLIKSNNIDNTLDAKGVHIENISKINKKVRFSDQEKGLQTDSVDKVDSEIQTDSPVIENVIIIDTTPYFSPSESSTEFFSPSESDITVFEDALDNKLFETEYNSNSVQTDIIEVTEFNTNSVQTEVTEYSSNSIQTELPFTSDMGIQTDTIEVTNITTDKDVGIQTDPLD